MREKLSTLPLSELKELAKAKGLRGISGLRKADLIEVLCRTEGEGKPEESAEKTEPTGKAELFAKTEQPKQPDQAEPPVQAEQPKQPDQAELSVRAEQPEPGKAEPSIRPEASVRTERSDMNGRRENVQSRRDGGRDNSGSRQDRSRTDGRNVRVVNRYDNRTGYQNRGRNQDNGGRRDYSRNQENRSQEGRNQEYRSQENRNQEN
ncbi:MAG: Rho termination factor N-terminal domain-containing protein, partial [Lachnospiraceae bacterium]|nr:Rho termination factor N-terminal domain-containing protein [Lachnospiraceae bacterium]